jgi:hypothetical protein
MPDNIVRFNQGFTTQKEKNMPPIISEIFGFLGFLLRAFGFLLFGFGSGRFMLLTDFSSPGSAGAFALGAGIAFLMSGMGKKKDDVEEDVKKK